MDIQDRNNLEAILGRKLCQRRFWVKSGVGGDFRSVGGDFRSVGGDLVMLAAISKNASNITNDIERLKYTISYLRAC